MENDHGGPLRKVSNTRKRTSSNSMAPDRKMKTHKPDNISSLNCGTAPSTRCTWVENSFCSSRSKMGTNEKQTKSPDTSIIPSEQNTYARLRASSGITSCRSFRTSTPNKNTGKKVTPDKKGDKLNNSDCMLAEMDILSIEQSVNCSNSCTVPSLRSSRSQHLTKVSQVPKSNPDKFTSNRSTGSSNSMSDPVQQGFTVNEDSFSDMFCDSFSDGGDKCSSLPDKNLVSAESTNGHDSGYLSHNKHPSLVSAISEENILSNGLVKKGGLEAYDDLLQSNIEHQHLVNANDKSTLFMQSTPKGAGKNNISTPGSTSLADKIKKRLQENAGIRTPQMTYSEHLRKQMLKKAQLDAQVIKEEDSTVDIGPFYGLPSKVEKLYEALRGITRLYDWQDECLKLPAVLEGSNFIYSLPTSGGKTLVAEILILRELLCKKKNCLLILPFVSIVQEKVRNLSQFAVELDFLVEEYAGSKGRYPPVKRRKSQSLYIATMEKAHGLVNSMIENKTLGNIGLVVVDEMHMLGEGGSRGAILESTLLKTMVQSRDTQIIGMSATLSNIEDLRKFLNAEIYSNEFRPVELTEFLKLEDNIYRIDKSKLCVEDKLQHERVLMLGYTSEMSKMDPDQLFGLVLEVIPAKSCLLFCPTKKNCESVAQLLCRMMVKFKRGLAETKKKERKALLKELFNDGCGKICPILQYCIHFGVAYHHSGLTADERKLIEEAYSEGILCLLTCTSTLAAGVNLPAKRVILRSPNVGLEFLSCSQYKQMIGRAGRAGIDTSGESILIAKRKDMKQIEGLIGGPIEKCFSSLMFNDGQGVSNIILSTIGLDITPTVESVEQLIGSSLLAVQSKERDVDIPLVTSQALSYLTEQNLILCNNQSDLKITALGRAVYKGSVNITYGPQLYMDLKKAEEGLILANYLHLLYLVTPYDMVKDVTPSWSIYVQEILHLDPAELKVASQVGVSENYIIRKASCQSTRQRVDETAVKRFYLTLMLYSLWKQKTVWEVAEKFQTSRGFIQNLLSGASSFASCVFHFCQELEEFWSFEKLLEHFVKQLSYCVSMELIPLMEIPGVKLGRARQLYNAGCRTLAHVANTDPEKLVKTIEHMPRKAANQIVASAKLLLNEKAEELLQEVEQLVNVSDDIFADLPQDFEMQQYSPSSVRSNDILSAPSTQESLK